MFTFASIAAVVTVAAGTAVVALFTNDTVKEIKRNQSNYALSLGA